MKREELIQKLESLAIPEGMSGYLSNQNDIDEVTKQILAEFDRLYELLLGCRNELAGLEDWEQSVSICAFIKQLNIELREWGKL